MPRTKSLAALLMGTALISLPAFSQEGPPENKSEASAQFFGTFLKKTDQNASQTIQPFSFSRCSLVSRVRMLQTLRGRFSDTVP